MTKRKPGHPAHFRAVGGPLDGWLGFRIEGEFPPSWFQFSQSPEALDYYERRGRRYVWRRVKPGRG